MMDKKKFAVQYHTYQSVPCTSSVPSNFEAITSSQPSVKVLGPKNERNRLFRIIGTVALSVCFFVVFGLAISSYAKKTNTATLSNNLEGASDKGKGHKDKGGSKPSMAPTLPTCGLNSYHCTASYYSALPKIPDCDCCCIWGFRPSFDCNCIPINSPDLTPKPSFRPSPPPTAEPTSFPTNPKAGYDIDIKLPNIPKENLPGNIPDITVPKITVPKDLPVVVEVPEKIEVPVKIEVPEKGLPKITIPPVDGLPKVDVPVTAPPSNDIPVVVVPPSVPEPPSLPPLPLDDTTTTSNDKEIVVVPESPSDNIDGIIPEVEQRPLQEQDISKGTSEKGSIEKARIPRKSIP